MDQQVSAETTGKGRRPLRWGVAAGVVAAIAIGGIGFAYAQTSTTSSSTSTSNPPSSGGSSTTTTAPHPAKPGPPRGGPRGPIGPVPGIGGGGAIHGEFVIKNGSTYITVDTQIGTVTAVDNSSITVKSEDGFEKKYAVTADTAVDAKRDGIASVKTNDTVVITAKVSGSTATATTINDTTLQRSSHDTFYPPPSPSTTQA
jgi:hypothetical protein